MQLKPDELPDMVEDEIRRVTLNLSGAVGINTINSATVSSDTLTCGTPSISGTSVTFTVTADNIGTHYILASCDLSSSETIKGYIRAKVTGKPCISSSSDDYRE
jgi:hypothetical protein